MHAADAIRVENIRKSFGVVKALEDVSLHLRAGRGARADRRQRRGKSTLIKILTGFHKPDAGRIFVHGEEVQLKSVTHARSLGIDTVFQDLALVPGTLRLPQHVPEPRGHARDRPAPLPHEPRDAQALARVPRRHRRARSVDRRRGRAHVGRPAPGDRDRALDALGREDPPARRAAGRDGGPRGCADHRADRAS